MTKNQRGFTLIEALIASAILAAALMSVFAIMTRCTVELRRAKHRTIASNAAQAMIEMILSSPYLPTYYHALSTDTPPPDDNPVRADLLTWSAMLSAFPTHAVGAIRVAIEEYAYVATVDVSYGNYGRNAVSSLSVYIPKTPE